MVTKPISICLRMHRRYVLAKIQMVTKRTTDKAYKVGGYVLAKIQMVTKHSLCPNFETSGYVLAKIQMVTKPQINIIII